MSYKWELEYDFKMFTPYNKQESRKLSTKEHFATAKFGHGGVPSDGNLPATGTELTKERIDIIMEALETYKKVNSSKGFLKTIARKIIGV